MAAKTAMRLVKSLTTITPRADKPRNAKAAKPQRISCLCVLCALCVPGTIRHPSCPNPIVTPSACVKGCPPAIDARRRPLRRSIFRALDRRAFAHGRGRRATPRHRRRGHAARARRDRHHSVRRRAGVRRWVADGAAGGARSDPRRSLAGGVADARGRRARPDASLAVSAAPSRRRARPGARRLRRRWPASWSCSVAEVADWNLTGDFDEEALVAGVSGAVVATAGLLEAVELPQITIAAGSTGMSDVAIEVTQNGVAVDAVDADAFFDAEKPDRLGGRRRRLAPQRRAPWPAVTPATRRSRPTPCPAAPCG